MINNSSGYVRFPGEGNPPRRRRPRPHTLTVGQRMRSQEITIKIHEDLSRVTDETLALYWHIAQANPAPHGDYHAGELTRRVGAEIVQRWMAKAPMSMYHHQPRDHYAKEIGKVAKYIPGCRDAQISSKFHDGEWVPLADYAARKAEVDAVRSEAATASADDLVVHMGQTVAIVAKKIVASAPDFPALMKYLRDNNIDADGCQVVTEYGVDFQRKADQRGAADG